MSSLNLENQLLRIPFLTKIIKTESCLLIYSYLALFGKTTPAELRKRTNLSKATIFRNLSLLTEAGILTKEINDQIIDRRYNLEYYISETLADISKIFFSKRLLKYVESQKKLDTLDNLLSQLEFLPLILNRLTSQLMISTCKYPSFRDGKQNRVVKTLIFRLKEEENYENFHKKLMDLIEYVDTKKIEKKRNMKEPMKNPVAFSVSIVAYDDVSNIENRNIIIKAK